MNKWYLVLACAVLLAVSPAIASDCANPPSDRIAWWPGEEVYSEECASRSGGIWQTVGFGEGVVGEAFDFTQQGWVWVEDDPEWTFAGDFTIALWVNFRSLPPRTAFISHDDGGGCQNKWVFSYDEVGHEAPTNTPALRFHIQGPDMGCIPLDTVIAPWTPELDRWYHVAVTRDQDVYKAYIDGTLEATDSDGTAIPDAGYYLEIGRAEGLLFDGLIDEVQVFDRALTGAEIGDLYLTAEPLACSDGGPYEPDAATSLLLHLDGSFEGSAGETPIEATGATFEIGRIGPGVRLGDSDELHYTSVGNIQASAGTVEFWVKPDWAGLNSTHRIFFQANQFVIYKDGANNFRFVIGADDSEAHQAYWTGSWQPDEWHHVAVTWEIPGEMTTYIDGEVRISHPASSQDLMPLPATLMVGRHWEAPLDAVVDELRISSVARCVEFPSDSDGDGLDDDVDNCPTVSNPDQGDNDLDGTGDACDEDDDNDGVLDGDDNCQFTANPDQLDSDFDGAGNACDADVDGDGICQGAILEVGCTDINDNCPLVPNPYQTDTDGDGSGDACDADDDGDGICDTDEAVEGVCAAGADNCPVTTNPGQEDLDGDAIGDACDADVDGDGVCEGYEPIGGVCQTGDDNCPGMANADQEDTDGDGDGDACDTDDDDDGVLDGDDNCALIPNADQEDADSDGRGDVCDDDLDGDGVANEIDNCPYDANGSQADFDGDGVGDVCDPDDDDDGVIDGSDDCAGTSFGELVDPTNGCSIDQVCPCDGPRGSSAPWRNHGKYVSCVAHAAESFLDLGLISEGLKDAIVSDAAQSACGKKTK